MRPTWVHRTGHGTSQGRLMETCQILMASKPLARVRAPCDKTCERKRLRRFSVFRSVNHQKSVDTYHIASIFDSRLMRPYTCTYNVTGIMQLYVVTDADHGQHAMLSTNAAQLPLHRAISTATRPPAFCHVQERATCKGANRLRRRGMATTSLSGWASLHAAPL